MRVASFLPHYYIGLVQDFLDLEAGIIPVEDGKPLLTKEYHVWCPDDPPTPSSVIFVIMRDSGDNPHPHWRALPHILDQTPLHTHFSPPAGQPERRAAVAAAMAQTDVPITAADTTFTLAMKLHAKMPCFRP